MSAARADGSPRIVVTGVGTVNACAAGGRDALAAALAAGRPGIGPLRRFSTEGAASRLGAEVDDATLAAHIDRDAARRLSRICQLTVAACRLALADAGRGGGPDLAMVVGTELGDFDSSGAFAKGFLQRGIPGLSPMIFPNTVMNSMGAAAAIAVEAKGPTVTLNQATVAGDLAVARGAALVRAGLAGAALAGGVDELCEDVFRRLGQLRAISPMGRESAEGCRPFAADHNGPVMGEGATFLVLEDAAGARARGARVLAEVTGASWGNVPAAPYSAPARRRDRHSPVTTALREAGLAGAGALDRCLGAGNGDPDLDEWEHALLEADLGAEGRDRGLLPPRSLAALFGQHGGLGALRVAAAALEGHARGGRALVHGLARGGCRTALLVAA